MQRASVHAQKHANKPNSLGKFPETGGPRKNTQTKLIHWVNFQKDDPARVSTAESWA